ncbi:Hypothetical predicted protein [Mytilus galloprovincialis]|uniref:Beta-lactamase-related domain-containing protein n=2 Tax=Mytilus galloprovincialis TaxID=29158 RepID=A0A8B6DZZ8_MYTGA|nr:Hypothetical predicted protein [Mytilus galloprovincialis]
MRMLIFVYVFLSAATAQQPGLKFEEGFQEFLNTNKYNGAQVGVMVANRLAYAKAHGKGHDDTNLDLLAKHQISAISKAFTSIAILKLHDEGKLTLDSKVFGTDGILPEVKPLKKENIDKRIYDITVENLLYHTAGWDYVHSSMADPMLNSALLKRGETTQNISKEMKLVTDETSRDIIRYMLSERLDYTPGTKSVISNLGYVILGRIIEEVTDFPYEDYVKTNILFPCGMMHTRIGKIHRCVKHDNDPAFKCEVTSRLVDAALGWESNMYDLARFSQCMDGSVDFSIISDKMANMLLHKQKAVPVQHSDTWIGPGFHVNNKGAIWIESERYTNDLLFYHTGPFHGKLKSILERHKPTALIVLLEGQNYAPIKYLVREMVHEETNWPSENLLIDDVADVTLKVGNIDRIIKYEINEHHIKPYTHAIGQLRYDIKWIHGHMFSGSSIFTVIAEKTNIPIYDKVIVESGLSEKRLQTQKLHLEKSNYNLTFLHTYRSYTHDKRAVFLAIYRKHAYANTTIIRYGEEHYTQPYRKLLHLFEERGFYPTSQSIVHSGYDGLVSFILEEDLTSKEKKSFKSYCEIGHHRLNNLVMSSFRHGRRLKYLDSSNYFGKPVFSAIFVKEKMNKIMFNSNINEAELMTLLTDQQRNGLLPSIIVGYTDKYGDLKYATYLEPPK